MNKNNYLLKNMTWLEIQQKMKNGCDTVIINIASTEQHGPHLPECTDEAIGIGISCGLAEMFGNTLVAPSIIPGLSDHHLSLPGSLSLRPEVLTGIVEDYVSCYVRHGFKKFIMYPSHSGNMGLTIELISVFKKKYPDHFFVNALTLDLFQQILTELEEEYKLPTGTNGGHADNYETSIMLYLEPELVKMDQAKPGNVNRLTTELAQRLYKDGIVGISEIGVLGDPTLATVEMGEEFYHATLKIMKDYICEQFENY